jgi:hypothetical protein
MPSSDLDDIIARAAEDRPFRKQLVQDPEETARAAGYRLTKEDVEILRVMAEEGEDAFTGEAGDLMSKPPTMIGVDEFLRTGGTGVGRVEIADDEEPAWGSGDEEEADDPEEESGPDDEESEKE